MTSPVRSLPPPFPAPAASGLAQPPSPASPREYLSAPIVLITALMYPDLNDARFLCALDSCDLAAKNQIPVIAVDDSPLGLHEKVKEVLEERGKGWVRVVKFRGKGKKAASIRQAMALAMKWRSSSSPTERWVTAFSEFEKSDFLNHVRDAVQPILKNEADIVTPGRDEKLFQETYASEQYHSESLARTYLNMLWRKEGGESDLDWLFGPICWEGNSVGPFYMESNEESWDAQIIPSIRASRTIGSRWIGVTIPYRHHKLQREQEQNSLEFCEKRVMQLNLMISLLSRAMAVAGRLPTIIVAGAAGNLGQKIVRRLLTTTVADYMYLPTSSRPTTPVDETAAGVKPTKFKLVLMDAKPCPPELDLTNTNGHEVEYVVCDFSKYDQSWVKRFNSCYVAFLLAAKNPFPEATSSDAYQSMIINSNLLEACAAGRADRVVFASSNHVVGGLRTGKGMIEPDAEPSFGTKYSVPGASMDSTLYASAKVAGEAQVRAMVASGRLSRVIILRIGWCQPGVNHISTISVTGTPTVKEAEHDAKRVKMDGEAERDEILAWFRGMHLRNEDLDRIVDCCVAPGLESKSSKVIPVNAVSGNPGARWLVHGNDLGYVPVEQEE